MTKKQKKMLVRIILSSALMIGLAFLPIEGAARFFLYLIPYLIIGYDILKKAVKGILNRQVFNESFLMATATIGAMIIGAAKSCDYVEAIAVMLFYQVGELFQGHAVGKSRRSISELMDIRPDHANVEEGGGLKRVSPDELAIGTLITVQPGEKIPIDGIVIEGRSSLNTSALTGESLPHDVSEGNEVLSGCINVSGVLKIRTTKEFGESTASKILDLVENASSRKSRSENFISRFAKIYTPAVCFSALALSIIPPLFTVLFLEGSGNWSEWIYRALSFLVASCPCALVISIPLSFFAAIGGASKEGILVKGSNYLEALAQTDHVVFDKTGTLTRGVFEVTAIYPNKLSRDKLIEYAALAEIASSHPIAKGLQRAYGSTLDRSRVNEIKETSGNGVTAIVDGRSVAVGNDKLMETLGIAHVACTDVGTVVHIAIDNEYAGCVVISDVLKPSSAKAISELKKLGIKKTVMLTGDSKAAADNVADSLGIDKTYSELLPHEKVSKLEELICAKSKKTKLAFVGDGINDAPVLSRADIGIAMGAIGSDAAIEAADVVLMDDEPLKIAKAIRISRRCLRIVHQNIGFAISIKLLSLVFVCLGAADMWIAIFADVGVMVLAVLNAIRTSFVKKS